MRGSWAPMTAAQWKRKIDWARNVSLTDLEREMLTWSAKGASDSEIGVLLGLSGRQVYRVLSMARSKIGGTGRVDTVAIAVSSKLIVLDE